MEEKLLYIAGRDQGERGTDDRAEQGGTRKGVGAVGAWRVLAALAALAPIASPRPAGPAPEPRPQPALDTSAGDSAEGGTRERPPRPLAPTAADAPCILVSLSLLFLSSSFGRAPPREIERVRV